MIDTVRVNYPISPTAEELKGWTHRISETATGFRESYIYNPTINDTVLRLTYFPIAYNSQPLLTLECSLPKLINGENFTMLASIDQAIQTANANLKNVPNLPSIDLAEGILIRLDMCYNHQVGETVDDYIKAIGNLDYPHRRTKTHRYEGVEFRAKHKTTKFYNKEHESGYTEAHGILRQEITLIRAKDIQKLLRVKGPTLPDVTKDFIAGQLKIELAKLGLFENSIATHDTALETLCRLEGPLAGALYFGLLLSKQGKSRKQITQETGMHPRSLDRRLQKIRRDGIPLTTTDREQPLPPLTIDL